MAEADDRTAIEYHKCSLDAAYFTNEYLIIDDAQGHGEGGGTMPFKLWPAQVGVMWALMTMRLIIILKARQLGISWISCGYALWLCVFQGGKQVLLFSKNENEAKENLQRIKKLFERLPEWMLAVLPVLTTDNTEELEWANGSRVRSFPSSPNAGRGFTASLVILDEAAFQAWASALYTALKPTIDGGGQLIILSTANGIGNLFHLLWTRATARLNDYTAIFLPWWSRPGRDQAWYARQLVEYTDPAMVKQEYPATATEAFLVSGRVRFQPDWIAAQIPNIRPALPQRELPDPLRRLDGLAVYQPPAQVRGPRRRIIIAADVAEGLESGDYSAATVADADSWEELAHLHGHWEPDEFARHLDTLARAYSAELAVERNNHGHAVLLKLKDLKTPLLLRGLDGRPGWLTTAKTKPIGVDLVAEALRDKLMAVRTQATLDELQIYRYDKRGGTSAPEGYNDDRVMTWVILLQIARRPKPTTSQETRSESIETF